MRYNFIKLCKKIKMYLLQHISQKTNLIKYFLVKFVQSNLILSLIIIVVCYWAFIKNWMPESLVFFSKISIKIITSNSITANHFTPKIATRKKKEELS